MYLRSPNFIYFCSTLNCFSDLLLLLLLFPPEFVVILFFLSAVSLPHATVTLSSCLFFTHAYSFLMLTLSSCLLFTNAYSFLMLTLSS